MAQSDEGNEWEKGNVNSGTESTKDSSDPVSDILQDIDAASRITQFKLSLGKIKESWGHLEEVRFKKREQSEYISWSLLFSQAFTQQHDTSVCLSPSSLTQEH
jgi:hypothetical protein